LEAYHTAPVGDGGREHTEPVHDWSSHAADAFRYIFEALHQGLVSSESFRESEASREYLSQFPEQHCAGSDAFDPWAGYSL